MKHSNKCELCESVLAENAWLRRQLGGLRKCEFCDEPAMRGAKTCGSGDCLAKHTEACRRDERRGVVRAMVRTNGGEG